MKVRLAILVLALAACSGGGGGCERKPLAAKAPPKRTADAPRVQLRDYYFPAASATHLFRLEGDDEAAKRAESGLTRGIDAVEYDVQADKVVETFVFKGKRQRVTHLPADYDKLLAIGDLTAPQEKLVNWDETVDTPAGKFAPCLRVHEIASPGSPITVYYFYCRGEGLVAMERRYRKNARYVRYK